MTAAKKLLEKRQYNFEVRAKENDTFDIERVPPLWRLQVEKILAEGKVN